jgi:hypothetical protein
VKLKYAAEAARFHILGLEQFFRCLVRQADGEDGITRRENAGMAT